MNTRGLIKKLKSVFNDTAPAKLVTYLNWSYQQIVNQDSQANIILNREDDEFPYPILFSSGDDEPWTRPSGWLTSWDNSNLTSTVINALSSNFVNSNQEYESWKIFHDGVEFPVTCRKVSNIFTVLTNDTLNDFQEIYRPIGIYPGIYTRYKFVKVPYQSRPGSSPDITFFGNLSEYKTPFFVEMYNKIPPLESETGAMAIDIDRWYRALELGVRVQRDEEQHGDRSKEPRFEMYKAEYLRELGGLSSLVSTRTKAQVF